MLIKNYLLLVLLTFSLPVLWGCRATQAGGTSHASVQLARPLPVIQQTAVTVFREEGYTLTATAPEQMVFDRPGSRSDALKWGGWSGQGVTMRVKVEISEPVDGGYLLEANAYAVQNSDDPFFASENRNILLNRRPYQKLLNKIADRLK